MINIDKDQLIFPNEKLMSTKLKQASKHSMAEKQFLADIVQKVSQMEDEKSYTKVGDSEFGQDDEFEELDLIRTEFRNYLN